MRSLFILKVALILMGCMANDGESVYFAEDPVMYAEDDAYVRVTPESFAIVISECVVFEEYINEDPDTPTPTYTETTPIGKVTIKKFAFSPDGQSVEWKTLVEIQEMARAACGLVRQGGEIELETKT